MFLYQSNEIDMNDTQLPTGPRWFPIPILIPTSRPKDGAGFLSSTRGVPSSKAIVPAIEPAAPRLRAAWRSVRPRRFREEPNRGSVAGDDGFPVHPQDLWD